MTGPGELSGQLPSPPSRPLINQHSARTEIPIIPIIVGFSERYGDLLEIRERAMTRDDVRHHPRTRPFDEGERPWE